MIYCPHPTKAGVAKECVTIAIQEAYYHVFNVSHSENIHRVPTVCKALYSMTLRQFNHVLEILSVLIIATITSKLRIIARYLPPAVLFPKVQFAVSVLSILSHVALCSSQNTSMQATY